MATFTQQQAKEMFEKAKAQGISSDVFFKQAVAQGHSFEGLDTDKVLSEMGGAQPKPQKGIVGRTVDNIKEAVKDPLTVIPQRISESMGTDKPLLSYDESGKPFLNKEQAQKLTDTVAGTVGGTTVVKRVSDTIKAIPIKAKERAAQKATDFIDQLITPELSKKATETAIKTGRVVENKSLTGSRNITEAVSNFDSIKEAVRSVKGIDSKKTLLENSNLIHDEISNVAESLKSQLKNKGFFSPGEFRGYMNSVKAELKDNPLIVGDAEKVAEKISNKFNVLVKENGYTPEGLLNARKQLDSWISSQKGSSIFDPGKEGAVSVALRAIRQGGNNFLAQRVSDVPVRELLLRQSNLYQAIDNIAGKAAQEGGSKLKRFIKANPVKTKLLKYGATAAGGGLILDSLNN